jgi:hypothetical protein
VSAPTNVVVSSGAGGRRMVLPCRNKRSTHRDADPGAVPIRHGIEKADASAYAIRLIDPADSLKEVPSERSPVPRCAIFRAPALDPTTGTRQARAGSCLR